MRYRVWYYKNAGDLTNKTVVVTGATGSIGKACAYGLAQCKANIILAVRDLKKGEELKRELQLEFASVIFTVLKIDVSSPQSIYEFSQKIKSKPIYALIHNAAIFHQKQAVNDLGVELHLATNAVGACYLTELLFKQNPTIKIVGVGSLAYKFSEDYKTENTSGNKLYGKTKRLFMASLLAYKKLGADVTLVHPGICATNLLSPKKVQTGKFLYRVAYPCMKLIFMSPQKACLPIMYALFHPLPFGQWYAPRGLFQVWGYPKSKRLDSDFLSNTNFNEARLTCLQLAKL